MLNMSFLFHANLLYAEYAFERIPDIVEKSYLPVLEAVLAGQNIKSVFNFSGFTLELLAGEHPDIYAGKPEVLSLIREGISRGLIELTGTSWAHAVLPTLPLALQPLDIGLFRATAGRLLGAAPEGFFPPELGISPLLPELLVASGYRWCVVDRELAANSSEGFLNDFNDFTARPQSFTKLTAWAQRRGPLAKLKTMRTMNRTLRVVTDYTPFDWQGTGNAVITAFPLESAWIALSLLSLSRSFLYREKALAKRLRRQSRKMKGFLFPYSSDIEFFGLGGNTLPTPIPIARVVNFFKLLADEGVQCSLPGEYLRARQSSGELHYCKAGAWSTDKSFSLWTDDPDNKMLDGICGEAMEAFKQKESALSVAARDEILKDLLLAFNSDGRGWTPLAEHRLFCYNKAKKVLDALR